MKSCVQCHFLCFYYYCFKCCIIETQAVSWVVVSAVVKCSINPTEGYDEAIKHISAGFSPVLFNLLFTTITQNKNDLSVERLVEYSVICLCACE